MPLEPDDDLHWLAFLYVSGELDGDGRSAFEDRLDRDQEAREAVAGAVGMAEAVAMLPVGPGSVPAQLVRLRLPVRRRPAWLAAAACLVAVSVPAFRALRPAAAETPMADVALAWSDLQGDRDGSPGETELISWNGVTDTSDASPVAEVVSPPPSWLLVAASAPADPDATDSQED